MFRNMAFDKLLDRATNSRLMEPDWPSILQICDLIRQNDIQPKQALLAIKKKLISTNPHTVLYALLLLESIVKNCGSIIHEELSSKVYCETLHELVKTTQHEDVRQRVLELIQAWTFAFRKNPKCNALKDTLNLMKQEGFKFPVIRESDAMFSADSAPEWLDGNVCHRCRVPFSVINRKHHCRACGQVFCGTCSSKNMSLPKFGIEKEVRVCDGCYDQHTKPSSSSSKATSEKSETELPAEYLNSSLAQQSQAPPSRKSDDELREKEELELALALSQSEAEAKEKEKLRSSATYNVYKVPDPVPEHSRTPSPPPPSVHPDLAKYLDRNYWEVKQQKEATEDSRGMGPSAPSTLSGMSSLKICENGVVDVELEDFVNTLRGHLEIFINRMKSNSSRGRSIVTDNSVQTIFLNITDMHSRLLRYIQQHDDSRLHYERLQDKLTQIKDARAALDALREEHRDKLRRQAEEAERQRQLQMAHKLEIMRKKKQEYLQYQRQLALQRIQEQERELQMRQEQQKQQYMLPNYGNYMGSPIHGQQQFAGGPPKNIYPNYHQYGPSVMPPNVHGVPNQMPGPPQTAPPPQFAMMQNVPGQMQLPMSAPLPQSFVQPPGGVQQQQQSVQMNQQMPIANIQQAGPSQMPPGMHMTAQPLPGPANNMKMPPQMGAPMSPPGMMQYQQQQPGAPPASPQTRSKEESSGTQTAELISFD